MADAAENKSIAPQESAARGPVRAVDVNEEKQIGFFEGIGKGLAVDARKLRVSTIKLMPRTVVNNSSNFIGFMQMIAEVLMFKSTNNDLWVSHRGKFMEYARNGEVANMGRYVIEPVQRIITASFQNARITINPRDLLSPSKIWAGLRDFNNLEKATQIDSAGGTKKLINTWSSRSSFAGLVGMTIATLLPEKKDTPEEVEKNTKLAKNNPVLYVAKRYYQALNPIEWFSNKRQFAGLGMTLAGIFSFISGFRQIEGPKDPNRIAELRYIRNPWQMAGGVITTIAGQFLMLSIDNQSGWTNFGGIQMLRMGTLVPSITRRFKPNPETGHYERGAEWYLAGQGVFQSKNIVAALIGGAEKRADGTVVDQVSIRKEAGAKAVAEREARKATHDHKDDMSANDNLSAANDQEALKVPSSTVSQPKDVALALPEHVKAKQAALAAATA